MLYLSTAAHSKSSHRSWGKIQSARWVNIQSANTVHPFADGNGRTGRALALWELYRRGFDTHHNFSVDEYYWEDRPRYYKELDAVRKADEDLSGWLEYCAEGLRQTLERV